MFDSGAIQLGEVRWLSLLGVKGLRQEMKKVVKYWRKVWGVISLISFSLGVEPVVFGETGRRLGRHTLGGEDKGLSTRLR